MTVSPDSLEVTNLLLEICQDQPIYIFVLVMGLDKFYLRFLFMNIYNNKALYYNSLLYPYGNQRITKEFSNKISIWFN